MAGLFDFQDPDQAAMFGAAAGLLSSGGPSRVPISVGQGIAAGLTTAQKMQLEGLESGRRTKFLDAQTQRILLENEAATRGARNVAAYAATLPESQRSLFLVNPSEYVKPFTLKPGEQRMVGNSRIAGAPVTPQLVEVPVQGQPGVTQKMWLRPGDIGGPQVGAQNMPELLNPAIEAAKVRIAQAGATKNDIRIQNEAESAYSQGAGKFAIDRDTTTFSAAEAGVDNDRKLTEVLKLLKTGAPITGPLAEIEYAVKRFQQVVLDNKAAGKAVTDTQLLEAFLGSDVFPMIKQLGIGARGLDTPAEREFMISVLTGRKTMNRETLTRMTEIRRDIARRAVEKWNDREDRGDTGRFHQRTGIPAGKFNLTPSDPLASMPQTGDPLIDQYLPK